MPQHLNPNELNWEPVEIPLAGGLDTSIPSRSVVPPRLLQFQNGRFDSGRAGISKRRGHASESAQTLATLLGSNGPSAGWVFGLGDTNSDTTSRPKAGVLRGMAARDTEVMAWDGFRMFSWPSGNLGEGWQTPVSAVMPSAKSTPIAKYPHAQREADFGMANGIAVVAWISPAATGDVYISVYDSTTWAPRMLNNTDAGRVNAQHLRVIPCGDWVHIIYVETGNTLKIFSIHGSDPSNVRTGLISPGNCDDYFEARRVSDDLWAIVKRDTTNQAKITFFNPDGSLNTAYTGQNHILATTNNVDKLSFDVHPVTHEICLLFRDVTSGSVKVRVYASNGLVPGTERTVQTTTLANLKQLGVAARYEQTSGEGLFDLYVYHADSIPSVGRLFISKFNKSASDDTLLSTVPFAHLSSVPFRVGNATFCIVRGTLENSPFAGTITEVQRAYYILDSSGKPVGMLERFSAPGTANVGLNSVHFEDGQGIINRTRFYTLLSRRNRIDSEDNDQFDEESLKRVELNFLPPLRSAQLGRATYFAGAQVSYYDGKEVAEAGFHVTPEHVNSSIGAAGNLTGTYQYKVRPAYKNAQGEEIIGPAITIESDALTADKCVLDGPTLQFTRKDNVYFLIYRRTATGSEYFLVSSRDSTDTGDNKFVLNDKSVYTWTFTDNLSDTDLISRERDRGNSGLLEPFSGLACEGIAAGRDRLWTWGGEIEPGSVLPSLIFQPEAGVGTAEFNGFLTTVIDRGVDPLTGFSFMGNSTLAFKQNRIYAFEADGPTNLGAGSFDYPRVIAADVGAISQESLVLTNLGVLFQSDSGFQLLGTNYYVQDIGAPIRDIANTSTVKCGILVSKDQEVRFYREDASALVFNYRTGEWGEWTNLEATGGVKNPSTGLAVLSKDDGYIWVETEGLWTDAGVGYTFLFQTAWLHAGGLQEFQRARKLSAVGDMHGTHTLSGWAYYDDQDFHEDYWTWVPTTDLNNSTWGEDTWGAGIWGDTNGSSTVPVSDRVYTFVRRLARQKCSRVSFKFSDNGADSQGPAFTAIALELGRRGGLTRSPTRTFGS